MSFCLFNSPLILRHLTNFLLCLLVSSTVHPFKLPPSQSFFLPPFMSFCLFSTVHSFYVPLTPFLLCALVSSSVHPFKLPPSQSFSVRPFMSFCLLTVSSIYLPLTHPFFLLSSCFLIHRSREASSCSDLLFLSFLSLCLFASASLVSMSFSLPCAACPACLPRKEGDIKSTFHVFIHVPHS